MNQFCLLHLLAGCVINCLIVFMLGQPKCFDGIFRDFEDIPSRMG